MRSILYATILAVTPWLLPQLAVADSVVSSGAAMPWVRDAGEARNTWTYSDPTASDTVTYTAGPDQTDGVTWPAFIVGPVTKFANPLGPKFLYPFGVYPDVFKNFGPGAQGSRTSNYASGNGVSISGFFYGTNWVFCMNASASGVLGKGTNPSFNSATTVADPSYLGPSAFAGVATGDAADVYIPIALLGPNGLALNGYQAGDPLGTELDSNATATLHVDIQTATADYDLFDLALNGATGDATITPSPLGSSVQYYIQNDITDGPPTNSPTDIADLESAIDADMSAGALTSDFNIGIVFSGMTVPTQALDANGDLAAIDVDESAEDSAAAAPEPASLGMCAALMSALFLRGRRTIGAR
jgi:hypothetical protein